MTWLQFAIDTPREMVPGLEELFQALGALSVTCGDAANTPVLETGPGEVRLWEQTRVTALFPAGADAAALHATLEGALPPALRGCIHQERLADRTWERAWMDDFHPMAFGDRLWVCPGGQPAPDPDAVRLELDPGLAFGTGTHPTTALCLRRLDSDPPRDLEVIDYGCGSGILAVAALLLGARRALGIDHDPQALIASHANAERNGVAERLQVAAPGAPLPAPADLVLANILAGTLVELAPRLTALVRPGGRLLLSGILQGQGEQVTAAYAPAFDLAAPEREGDWLLIEGRRR